MLRPIFIRLMSMGNLPQAFRVDPREKRKIADFDFASQVSCQIYLPLRENEAPHSVPADQWSKSIIIYGTSHREWDKLVYGWRDGITDLARTIELQVGTEAQQGFRRVSFYCPFYIDNHTLLPIHISTKAASSAQLLPPGQLCQEGYLMYGPPNHSFDSSAKEDTVLSAGSSPSLAFSLSNPVLKAVKLTVKLSTESLWHDTDEDKHNCSILVSWRWGSLDRLWRIVEIFPSLVFINHSKADMLIDAGSVHEVSSFSEIRQPVSLPIGASIPINTVLKSQLWRIRSSSSLWSASFSAHKSQETLFLKVANETTGELSVIEAHCRHLNQHYEVHLFDCTHAAPWRVENLCQEVVVIFGQTGCRSQYLLNAGEQMAYTWDNPGPSPHWKRSFTVRLDQVQCESIEIEEFTGAPVLIKYSTQNGDERSVTVCTYSKNAVNALIIADSPQAARSYYGLYTGDRVNEEQLNFCLDVNMPHGLGVSLVESHARPGFDIAAHDFLWLCLKGISVSFHQTTLFQKLYASIADMQIDDQRYLATFPVIVHKTPDEFIASKPLFSLAYVERLGQLGFGAGQTYCQYFSFLLQPMSVNVDEIFIAAFLYYMSNLKSEFEQILLMVSQDRRPSPQVQNLYSVIELHPIQLRLTFKLSKLEDSNYGLFVRSIGVTVLNISDVSVQLDSLHLKMVKATQSELVDLIIEQYVSNFAIAATKLGILLVGSLEFLGDPLHTLGALSGGVAAFFYEVRG
jgi:hypothetical protein